MTTKPNLYKHLARDLYNFYPDRCTRNFEENKIFVEEFLNIKNRKIRNITAGLVTHNMNKLADEKKFNDKKKKKIKKFNRKSHVNKPRGDLDEHKRIY